MNLTSGSYRLHALLLAILAVFGFRAALTHEDRTELGARIESTDPEVRVRALHVKAARKGMGFSDDAVAGMLASTDALVRDLALLPTLMRFGTREMRETYIRGLEDRVARRRARFLMQERFGNFDEMSLSDLEEFLGDD